MSQDSATPANGQQVITAVVALYKYIDTVPHVLVAKRSHVKKFLPGKLELPGGHIDFGESLEAGLRRELHEELSISIILEDPFAAFTYMNKVKGSHSVEIAYLATIDGGEETIQLDANEHSETLWISSATIPQLIDVNGETDEELPAILRALDILNNRQRNA